MGSPATIPTILAGDCLDVIRTLAGCSIDAVVTDPPYGINFMGKKWDTGAIAFDAAFWREVLRVLKPGGHCVAFGGDRTYHRLAVAIEDAGFEVRQSCAWIFGQGFPKSLNVSKALDKAAGAEREVIGSKVGMPGYSLRQCANPGGVAMEGNVDGSLRNPEAECAITAPATDAAKQWDGWGTALKPAMELICLARKPLSEGTVAANCLRWGTGALNIDATRVEGQVPSTVQGQSSRQGEVYGHDQRDQRQFVGSPLGRWPANVMHDGSPEVVAMFPDGGAGGAVKKQSAHKSESRGDFAGIEKDFPFYGDSGSAARFFYSSKASKADRAGSRHPTVKPVSLIRWLARLVTPPGGTILDPFAGSGTTGAAALAEGFNCVLIEREAEYLADIRRRFDPSPKPAQPALTEGLFA